MATMVDRVAVDLAQRRATLDAANRARRGHMIVKQEVGEDRLSIARALDDPRAATLTIYDLLSAQRRWGSVRTARFLERVQIGERRRVEQLTARQKAFLSARCSTGKAA